MTTNVVESFNNVLKGLQALPLCAIIELTFYRTADYFCDRRNSATACDTRFSSKVEEILEKRRGKSHHHRTRIFDLQTNEFEIRCKCRYVFAYSAGDTIQQCQLRSNEATCTCNKPKLQHILCSHVIAACKDMGGNDASQYISLFYNAEALKIHGDRRCVHLPPV
jgi:hypothetical protein